jgi:ABC-type multidrug transport system ATPase subunit
VLETIHLSDFAGHLARTLSGGERPPVSIATAPLGEPQLSPLDHPPTAALAAQDEKCQPITDH